jgi:adenosylcobinamide-phosphate synthase
MISAFDLVLAFALDLIIGDPHWAPHPVRGIGAAISRAEIFLRKRFSGPSQERLGGVLLVLCIVLPTYLMTDLLVLLVNRVSEDLSMVAGTAALVWITATTIATRELVRSAQAVIASVERGDLGSARSHVGMIVGRDTRDLSEQGVLRAAIETLAENLSDGVVAPLFYLAIGGLPLAMAYKAVNTLDSMVGYKNERYRYFGWAAARLDDVANYVPARITGLLIVLSAFLISMAKGATRALSVARSAFVVMVRDGGKHPSPNSGVPESSMAGALGVQLGGPSTYGGVLVDKPTIGVQGTDDYLSASRGAIAIVAATSVLAMISAAACLALRVLA